MISYFALPQHPIKLFAKHGELDRGHCVNRAFCILFPHLAPLQDLPHPGFVMPVGDKRLAVLLNCLWRVENRDKALFPHPSTVLCDPGKLCVKKYNLKYFQRQMAVILGLLSMVGSLGLFSHSTVLVVLKVLRDSNQVSLLKQKLKISTSFLKTGSLRNTGHAVMPKVIRVCQCWNLEQKPALLTLLPILYPQLSSLNVNHGWSLNSGIQGLEPCPLFQGCNKASDVHKMDENSRTQEKYYSVSYTNVVLL